MKAKKVQSVTTRKEGRNQKASVLQIKVTLVGSKPSIWRRIVVPSDYSFFDLHVAIQDAFDWSESHLHQFFIASPFSHRRDYETISFPMPESDHFGFGDEEDLDERKTMVAQYLKQPKDTVYYEYDFGDSWMHAVQLEKVLSSEAGVKYPLLVTGKNATPPEDCGGLGGYYDLLTIIENPKDPEHADMREWLGLDGGDTLDPTAFDPQAVSFSNPKKRLREYSRDFM